QTCALPISTPVETRAVILVATLVAITAAILAETTVELIANVTGTVPCIPPARPQPVAGAGNRIAAVSATAPVTARTVQVELSVTNLLKERACPLLSAASEKRASCEARFFLFTTDDSG